MKPNSTLPKIIANERVDVIEDCRVFYGDESDGRYTCRCKKTKSQFYQSSSLNNAMMVWRTGGTSTGLSPMVGLRVAVRRPRHNLPTVQRSEHRWISTRPYQLCLGKILTKSTEFPDFYTETSLCVI